MKVKRFLNDVLQEILEPIRTRREQYQKQIPEVYKMLYEGSQKARIVAEETTKKVKDAMGINYFDDEKLINEHTKKFSEK